MSKYGSIIWIGLLALIAGFLIYPPTHKVFVDVTARFPYISGFVKFAILSMMGEFLAARLVLKKWVMVKGMLLKMLVWGILGMLIVLMFAVFSSGVDGAASQGLLISECSDTCPPVVQFISRLRRALMISALMNLTFGPVFMAAHRITDVYIDKRDSGEKVTFAGVIPKIDWG
ncbi:MAG: hypothetical protein LC133_00340, partial [Bacteroidales bacterium]|nr:hypothetical protein [Bacteroidales bacterium]